MVAASLEAFQLLLCIVLFHQFQVTESFQVRSRITSVKKVSSRYSLCPSISPSYQRSNGNPLYLRDNRDRDDDDDDSSDRRKRINRDDFEDEDDYDMDDEIDRKMKSRFPNSSSSERKNKPKKTVVKDLNKWEVVNRAVLAGVFVAGIGSGITIDSAINTNPRDLASRDAIGEWLPETGTISTLS